MTGTGFLVQQVEPLHHAEHAGLRILHPEPLLADAADVGDPQGRDAVRLGIGTAKDHRLQDSLFAVAEPGARARPGPVRKPGDAQSVEMVNESRSVCRSKPAASAAANRLMPERASAIARRLQGAPAAEAPRLRCPF